MRRRPTESKAVTLFPFLAVMICTMGALILVLLSLSGKMRVKAEQARDKSLESAVAMDPALPPVVIRHRTDPQSEAEKERRLRQWQEALRGRREELEAIQQLLAEKRAALDQSVTAVTVVDNQLVDLDQVIASALADSQTLEQQNQTLDSRNTAFRQQVLKAKKNLDELRKRQAAAPSKFALVPFEGSSGTVRRPIYLECRGDSIRFLPEGVVLRESDFEGFTTSFNPLLSGAQTLVEHWSRKHEDDPENNPKPYVLLLVRPSGALTYYAAKLMLSKLRAPYGYELLEESFPLNEPEPDPIAKALLEASVSTLLDAQPSLLARRGAVTPAPLGSARRLPGDNPGGSPIVGSVRNSMPRGLDVDAEPSLGPVPGSANPSDGPDTSNAGRMGNASRGSPPRIGTAGRRPASLGGDRESDPTDNTAESDPRLEADPGSRSVEPNPQGATPSPPGLPNTSPSTPGEPQKLPSFNGVPAAVESEEHGERLPRKQTPFRTGTPGREVERGAPNIPEGIESGPPQGGLRSDRRGAASRSDGDRAGLRWSNTGGATIGLEQDVKVHVYHDRIALEDGPALGIPAGVSKQQLAESFNNRIEQIVAEWGAPPRRFHWMPRIRFVVHPGGNQHYERLHDAVRQWKLSSTVDFSLDATQQGVGKRSSTSKTQR